MDIEKYICWWHSQKKIYIVQSSKAKHVQKLFVNSTLVITVVHWKDVPPSQKFCSEINLSCSMYRNCTFKKAPRATKFQISFRAYIKNLGEKAKKTFRIDWKPLTIRHIAFRRKKTTEQLKHFCSYLRGFIDKFVIFNFFSGIWYSTLVFRLVTPQKISKCLSVQVAQSFI